MPAPIRINCSNIIFVVFLYNNLIVLFHYYFAISSLPTVAYAITLLPSLAIDISLKLSRVCLPLPFFSIYVLLTNTLHISLSLYHSKHVSVCYGSLATFWDAI